MELGFPKLETEVEDEGKEYSVKEKSIQLRKRVFSSSRESINEALKRISAWRSRGCLPIVIEVTASIIEIQLKDPFFRLGSSNEAVDSDEVLSMLYCMSILRLVNGVVEKTWKKTEVSIADAANAIGIPRMLIDIRHESSHRNLPSLNIVRLASVKRKADMDLGWAGSLLSSKKQVKRTLLVLVQLYSSFPMEVVAMMLEFLCISGCDEVGHVDCSKISANATDIWKLMVTRIASKGISANDTQVKAENRLLEYLSSLVPWLIDRLKKGKGPGKIGSGDKNLIELLRKCLLVSYPGHTHLSESAILLAQMLGNENLVIKLKKLSNLRLPSITYAEECSSLPGVEKILYEQEVSISEAAKKLELLKLPRGKKLSFGTHVPLVCCLVFLVQQVVHPVLDPQIKMPEDEQVTETSRYSKRQANCDVESLEISTLNEIKSSEAKDLKGYLMIGGVWKNVRRGDSCY
ncbi:hypothetical protein MKX03_003023 [Papaver bracteatum]|nr:hypothetical protein MKX03_003023 [Papaver bracteatum]